MGFKDKVFKLVKEIPPGKVASYGQIAAMAGSPRAGRQVGWMLASISTNDQNVPWWRVVNREGYLSIRGHDPFAKDLQKSLLEAEGVQVSDTYELDMAIYQY
jgi:methylated-DNA-protein-cysteine methyltransferase-like protein